MAEIWDAVLSRVPNSDGVGCFLCGLILEDVVENGRPTGAISDNFGKPMFPPEAMVRHLDLEGFADSVPDDWRAPPQKS